MLIGFQGVVPEELRIEVAGTGVDLETHDLDIDHAFKHVQSRPGGVKACVVAFRPLRAHLGGIACAGLPADARQQSTRLVEAQRLDQLAANGAEGSALQQHHALATQPDVAILGREGNGFSQLLRRGQASGTKLSSPVDDQAFLRAQQLLEEFLPQRPAKLARSFTSHGHEYAA
ncbi:hypothetical protein D3C76_794230 [compost metagenome]